MGADLVLCVLPCADTKKKGRRQEFMSLVRRMSGKSLEDLSVFAGMKIEAVRRAVVRSFGLFEQLKGFRDAGTIAPYADKPPVLITGGLSWGDDPTESFEPMRCLAEAPGVYELFERWAEEDWRTAQKEQ